MAGNVRRRRLSDQDQERPDEMISEYLLPSDARGDEVNIVVLLMLYLLQGIPLGLLGAIPMILQNRGATFKQQAEFSFVHWPFSMKLLWAPLVDSLYWEKFGRRKTWLVPSQYLIGLFMLIISCQIDNWLGGPNDEPKTFILTVAFLSLNFLAATQDIAVDGWALTMLKRENVGFASTCNTVGQTAGYFLGYVVFIALESAEFCNNYLRSTPQSEGLVTLPGFLYFWGITYIIITTLIAIFKREGEPRSYRGTPTPPSLSSFESYMQLLKIFKLPNIQILIVVLLTYKIGFAATDAVTSLKLVSAGVPREKLAILAIPLVPLQICLPIVISKYYPSPRPMDLFAKVMPYRLLFNFAAVAFVFFTPMLLINKEFPPSYYFFLIIFLAVHQITVTTMFVQVMAFFARISDPAVGGTYMSLLNTITNLGGTCTSTIALWLVDTLTWKACSSLPDNDCSSHALVEACEAHNSGSCDITFDGFYLESILCTVIGFLWYSKGKRVIHRLQSQPVDSWKVHEPFR